MTLTPLQETEAVWSNPLTWKALWRIALVSLVLFSFVNTHNQVSRLRSQLHDAYLERAELRERLGVATETDRFALESRRQFNLTMIELQNNK